MQTEFRALLTGSAEVTALVPAARINWKEHPQDAPFPAIILHLIGNAPGLTQQGPTSLWSGRVQVDCLALDYATAAQIGAAVTRLLNGYRGGGFRGVFLASTRDDQDTGASDRPFLISTDFMTHWRET
ncbi:tail completion protein gp17 [Paenirhodobacter enshiensis]|uniref:Gene transfer agent protein n=1 Tax=Paenirhodobacter enshiensis TaxID=1105367 RepID=A0A086XQM7_9RHOB|nr:DUF3168 domain-containing protein [Paenirhodobacter enshiensis]KFI24327.1 hypothetical protein CG50_10795 [Paenirhodobacter enshiensis]